MDIFVLPFDHRDSFERKLLGIRERPPTAAEEAEIRALKATIYRGFRHAVSEGVPRENAAILVDDRYGAAILAQARVEGFRIACATEESGREELAFEHGDRFAELLDLIRPDYAKALVRYNPEGDAAMNDRQARKLRLLSDYCRSRPTRLMLEVLVTPTEAQLAAVGGDRGRFEAEIRPQLMAPALMQLQAAGIEPTLWKLEGMENEALARQLVAQARSGGRDAGIILLGRAESDATVRRWVRLAAKVPGYAGFAIGRTLFWEPLTDLRRGAIQTDEAARRIGHAYLELCRLWTEERRSAGLAVTAPARAADTGRRPARDPRPS